MQKPKTIVIGAGGMAQSHIHTMLTLQHNTSIVAFVEPNPASQKATIKTFKTHQLPCPPFYSNLQELLKHHQPEAALICTPHKFHFENTKDCLLAGMDVCLEKPMVMNENEAKKLIALRNKTSRLLMVAFPGSLSPAIWKAKKLIAKKVLGNITAISGVAYQNWKQPTTGTWRQDPEISGGGFLFDTGSHMVNTVVDLIGSDVQTLNAHLENRNTPVEIVSSVGGMFENGTMFSLLGVGDSIQCKSEITIFGDKAILKTGIWGESLSLKKANQEHFSPLPYPRSLGPWQQFLKVRAGKLPNPCPPEVGLRFAKLMDMIRKSANTSKTIRN